MKLSPNRLVVEWTDSIFKCGGALREVVKRRNGWSLGHSW